MRPLALSLILALFAPLTTPAFAQDTPRSKPTSSQKARFEGAYLTKRFAERFQGSLEKALGRTFDSPVEFVITDTLGMSALIKQESEALSEALTDVDPAEFSKQSQALAKAVLAKIRLADGKILINPATFKLFSKLYDPGCWSESFLDAVLIHEAVHAAQHQAHSLGTFLRGQTKLPALRARMCVVEGHAQLVARQATKDLGLEEGFKLLLAVASELPKQVPPEHRELMKVLVAEAAIPYVAGEAFMKALAKAEGSTLKAEARAFKSPPTTIRQVTRPGEYLDPPPRTPSSHPWSSKCRSASGSPS
ncbi:MAG: hypothetical protein JKY65_05090 [Planctomycetes bacterium]|nr:hypothetical protein [Planctomycetota bacterium]